MTTPTILTIRDHCAAQVNDVAYLLECIRDGSFDPITLQGIADRANTARAALAAEAVGEGPEPTREQISQWINANPVLRPGATGGPMIRVGTDWLAAFADAVRWGAQFRPATPPAPEVGEGSDYDQEGAIAAVILDHSRVAASLGCPDPERNLGRVLRESDFGATARAILARWGRPATPPAPEVGEVAELVEWLTMLRDNSTGIATRYDERLTRAATLLEQQAAPAPAVAPVPVAVSKRPWEKGGWTDLDGECWWCPPDGPAYWSMANPAMVYGGWVVPAHAIPVPEVGEGES